MYTDIHCHLLPGVDDGVKTWEDSRACLEMAKREKISAVVVTPHIWPGKYPNTPEDLLAAFEAWKERARGMGLELHLGSEVYFQGVPAEDYAHGKFRAMGEAGRYLLVELPLLLMPRGVAERFYELRLKGAEPILAHPERYPYVVRDPGRLEPLASAGIPFQVTTHSVAGLFGGAIQGAAFELMERGWVQVLASDAHGPANRAPMFREAVRVVANRYGKDAARLLCVENPRRIVAGDGLLAVTCERVKRRFWS